MGDQRQVPLMFWGAALGHVTDYRDEDVEKANSLIARYRRGERTWKLFEEMRDFPK